MIRKVVLLFFCLYLVCGAVAAFAETLHVPEDYPTIQEAIVAAQSVDAVLVVAGGYKESLLIDKAVRLAGEGWTAVRIKAEERPVETLTAGSEIVVGLTRAFIHAGTPSVLSSLWRGISETPGCLMAAFCADMAGWMDKADDLRSAQLDVIASCPPLLSTGHHVIWWGLDPCKANGGD
ncbi:MAG: CHAT domain-containing protein [Candidatus Bipolaricaulia bacterium]